MPKFRTERETPLRRQRKDNDLGIICDVDGPAIVPAFGEFPLEPASGLEGEWFPSRLNQKRSGRIQIPQTRCFAGAGFAKN